MGMDASATICYGIHLTEDNEYPWDDAKFNGDIDSWWEKVKGFKPSIEIFDETGGWLGGKKPKDSIVSRYYLEHRNWYDQNKIPYDLVVYAGYEGSIKVLALREPRFRCDWDEPKVIDFEMFNYKNDDKEKLIAFCKEYNIKFESESNWYVCCSYG